MNENQSNRPSLDDYDDEAIHPERYPNKTLVLIGKCIKWFFCGLAAMVFIVMIWRINAMENLPKDMQTLTVTEATFRAYEAARARGETLEMITQGNIDPISTNDEAYGYFWVASSVIIPEAEQLQLVVRYNNSTLEHLASDFKLGEIPAREDEVLALPMGAYMLTLEQSIRFLGDYLNGDTYFRVHYPEHNLDRARNQMKLVADMEGKMDEMNRIIQKYV